MEIKYIISHTRANFSEIFREVLIKFLQSNCVAHTDRKSFFPKNLHSPSGEGSTHDVESKHLIGHFSPVTHPRQ